MSEHRAIVEWKTSATEADFTAGRYPREHVWMFDGGVTVPATAAPSVVPAPWSSPGPVDPEEAFVASIASCHMLTYLYVAAKAGFAVATYRDEAVGILTRVPEKTPWISQVKLRPTITFSGRHPTEEEAAALHHKAHVGCFIAASIKTEVTIG